jgi:hypothetical protein
MVETELEVVSKGKSVVTEEVKIIDDENSDDLELNELDNQERMFSGNFVPKEFPSATILFRGRD